MFKLSYAGCTFFKTLHTTVEAPPHLLNCYIAYYNVRKWYIHYTWSQSCALNFISAIYTTHTKFNRFLECTPILNIGCE